MSYANNNNIIHSEYPNHEIRRNTDSSPVDYSDLYDDYLVSENASLYTNHNQRINQNGAADHSNNDAGELDPSLIQSMSSLQALKDETIDRDDYDIYDDYSRHQALDSTLEDDEIPEVLDQDNNDDDDDDIEDSSDNAISSGEEDDDELSGISTPAGTPFIPQSSEEWRTKGAAQIVQQVEDSNGNLTKQVVRKSINDFKIGKELGEGSYSTVMLATDITTSRQYAIKILDKKHIIREKKVKYVNIEKNALNRLGVRNGIIHLFYTFQDEQSLYFVLDYASNGELLTLIKKHGTMNEESVRYYSAQLVDAVAYMHDSGIIHRDLKPENILIDSDMKIQITDFGTAKILDLKRNGSYPSDARCNSFVGTAEYVSPELLNDKYSGKCSDVWALGCIVYQMIAGKPPFKATNEYLTFQKVVKLQYAFSAGFPMVVRDLVKRILVLKPRERLTINEIKEHHFFKDVNWNNPEDIWGHLPPELGPYKMSAKSMLPVPELSKAPFPQKRVATPNIMKSASSGNVLGINHNSVATTPPPTTSSVFGLPNPYLELKNTNSSPVLPSQSIPDSQQLSTAAAIATTKKFMSQPLPKTRPSSTSSSNSTIPQLGSSATQIASNRLQSNNAKGQPSASTAAQLALGSRRKQGMADHISSSSFLEQPTAKGKDTTTSSSAESSASAISLNQPAPSYTPPNIPSTGSPSNSLQRQKHIDVIPGTNIPRPVLNTRISTSRSLAKNSISSNSRSRTSLHNKIKPVEIPPMSVLDISWAQFLQHPDERVIKVGICNMSKYMTDVFEKKYRGMLAESPLGYKNRELLNSSNPSTLSQVTYSSATKKSNDPKLHAHYDYDDAIIFTELEDEDESKRDEEEASSSKDGSASSSSTTTNTSSTSDKKARFKSLFHYKTIGSIGGSSEHVAKNRTLLLTTFGRALVFVQNHDRTKQKYQCVAEIDLNNTHIHFKEVIGDRKAKSLMSSGIFAILSQRTTLAFEVEKQDLSSWTNSLAKSRFMEQERLVRKLIMREMHESGGDGGETALKAASIANAMKTPTLGSPRLLVDLPPSSPILDLDLLSGVFDGGKTGGGVSSKESNSYNYGTSASAFSKGSKMIRKPPPGSSSFPTSMRTPSGSAPASHHHHHHRKENDVATQRVISNNNPMISAAINKAISCTKFTGSSGLGVDGNDHRLDENGLGGRGNSKTVSSMNSKFVARTSRKKR